MFRLISPSKLGRLVTITVAVQILTLALSYVLWISDGCDPLVPFISDTDTNPASSWAFTAGFTISGILMTPLSIQFYLLRDKWSRENPDSGIEILNLISTISALLSGICLIWISHTPWHISMELHMIQARVIFGGTITWAILSTIIARRISEVDVGFSGLYSSRRNWTIFSLASLLALSVSVFSYAGFSLSIPAGHMGVVLECSDLGAPSLSIAAFFEWIMVIGFAGVSYTGVEEALQMDGERQQ